MKSPPELQTVLLRVPEDLPCYCDRDFRVWPGEFALFNDAVCDELTRTIKEDRRHYFGMWLFGAGDFRDYKTRVRLRKYLNGSNSDSQEILKEFQSTIWWIAETMIYARNFANYRCPACDCVFAPADGLVEEWSYGEGLGEHGGRRFECPSGHTVYAIQEWMS